VVAACAPRGVPVTLKMRSGWCAAERNAVRLARAAEAAGVAMVTVHGRTREQGYKGVAEYDTVAAVKAVLRIPVVANGDIDSPAKARARAGGHRGRCADDRPRRQGRPWIFREIAHFLASRDSSRRRRCGGARWLVDHLHDALRAVRRSTGVRSARKHIGWAVRCAAGRRSLPLRNEPARRRRPAAAGRAGFFDLLSLADRSWPAVNEPHLPMAA
jgi:tRNA-dihydrouridine synthase B